MDELAKRADEVLDARPTGTRISPRLPWPISNSQTALEGGALGWRKGPELPTIFAEVVVALQARRGQQAAAHAHRLPHRQAERGARCMGGGAMQDQVHARHILMKPNELQDDATVQQKLARASASASSRARISRRLPRACPKIPARRSTAATWAGTARAPSCRNSRAMLAEPEGQRDQRALPDPVRLAHRAAAGSPRSSTPPRTSLRQRAFQQLRESKADEETELWLRRLRDEAFVDTDV